MALFQSHTTLRRLNQTTGQNIERNDKIQINETYWILFLSILGVILLICLAIVTIFHIKLKKQNIERMRRKTLQYGHVEEEDFIIEKKCFGLCVSKKPKVQTNKIKTDQKQKPKQNLCSKITSLCKPKPKRQRKKINTFQNLELDPQVVGFQMKRGDLRFVLIRRQLRMNSLNLMQLEV